mgnify:CR=1 FL=1
MLTSSSGTAVMDIPLRSTWMRKASGENRCFCGKDEACRIVINTPSSHGGIGDLYNFNLAPSLTLGCGSWGGNSVSENVGVKHLLNIKTVAERRENMLWFRTPQKYTLRKAACRWHFGRSGGAAPEACVPRNRPVPVQERDDRLHHRPASGDGCGIPDLLGCPAGSHPVLRKDWRS